MKLKLKSQRKFETSLVKSFCYCSDSPPPPDYTAMANASEESARIMADLGREELDFAKLQYEENKPVLTDIADQQMEIADQTARQGQDYYDYLKSYRPAERSMMYESMGLTPDEASQLESTLQNGSSADYEAQLSALGVDASKRSEAELAAAKSLDEADAKIIGGTDSGVLAARRGEIDAGVGRAMADTQGAYTRNINQLARQGLRYGMAPGAITSQAGSLGLSQASQTASAANYARDQGIAGARVQAGTNMGLRRDIRDDATRQEAIGWAKKLDATGLVKGLPGASTGAYGLAVNAGNSAGANTMAPGQAAQAGMAQGASTIGQGRSLYQQGLGSIMNSQTQMYSSAGDGGSGAAIGAVGGIAAAFI